MLLADKVVLVAGVGPGLGQAVAVRAAQSGADVVLAARTGRVDPHRFTGGIVVRVEWCPARHLRPAWMS